MTTFSSSETCSTTRTKNNPWHLSLVPLREAFHTTRTLVTDGRSRTALIDLLRTELIYPQQDSISLPMKG